MHSLHLLKLGFISVKHIFDKYRERKGSYEYDDV